MRYVRFDSLPVGAFFSGVCYETGADDPTLSATWQKTADDAAHTLGAKKGTETLFGASRVVAIA